MLLTRPVFGVPTMHELRRELDRLFDNFVPGELFGTRPTAFPALNAWEDGERLMIEAEVPGLKLDDLEITVKGNELMLKGTRPAVEDEQTVYHRRERGCGEFARYVTLPVDVDADRVEAALKNGVLTIVLPKAEKARARKITVKTA